MKILVPYIATGDYIQMIDGFLDSLDNLFPGHEVKVVLLTDSMSDYSNSKIEFIDLIPHQPWPINALLKFHYIRRAYDLVRYWNPDYIFYFNSNIQFMEPIELESIAFPDKCTAVPHCAWDRLGHDPLKFTYGKRVDRKSKAYIPSDTYTYVQSGFMGGPTELYLKAVKDCIDWTEYDLAHNRIPVFHDESYWNAWIYLNKNYSHILDSDVSKIPDDQFGYLNGKLILRDSSATQYKYKDRFHE